MCVYSDWFDGLYIKHAPKMRSVALQLLKDRDTADDMVHSTFLTLLDKGAKMMDHPKPQAWLYVTLKNLIQNEQKLARNSREIRIEDHGDIHGTCDQYFSFDDILPRGLSDEERTILRMYFAEQESYEAIADYFGKNITACRTQLCRAKAHCAELMKNEEEFVKTGNVLAGIGNSKDRRCRDAGNS